MAAVGNFLGFIATKIELLHGGDILGSATGFFLKIQDQWFLVTNWHALSGRNNIDGQARHPNGAVPNKCRFYVAGYTKDKTQIQVNPHDAELGNPLAGNAKWYEHPTERQNVDVGVLPLGNFNVGFAKDLLDPTGHSPDMFVDLGAELFLPGFPLGLAGPAYMALWKRASLASSLEFGEGINKFFYVDTATREGMSGSPCLAISNWRHYDLNRATGKMTIVERPLSHRLLGVYSGRKNANDGFEAQIGIVWRENLIFETIAAKKSATVILK